MVDKIFEVITDVSRQGMTVLLVEQNASRALQIADRAYVMESGLITLQGPAQQLLHDPQVQAAYLGQ
jgi:branched-chain amino acid transport system ATP-binding protein